MPPEGTPAPSEGEPPEEPPEPPEASPALEERRHPSTLGGALYLLILAAMSLGVVLAYLDDWRLGARILGGALLTAGALRLVLPERDAGMLRVRHRLVDVGVLAVMGGAIVWLAGDIPEQPF
ncbi:DUF3017 domain-containing protein [Nocardioides nanhaiensis]|uniref:DUF3017 domain-containing protein n=1 Tax=Nocardioides nanhaiensis TaxID=1476871 RepID=A0ABP8W045_9ACTN